MTSFRTFSGRITGGYVALACALILLVVFVSTLLAFSLYAGTLDEAVSATAQRAADFAAQGTAEHRSTTQIAATIASQLGHGRVAVLVFDDAHRLVAGHPQPRSLASALLEPLGALFGVHRQSIRFNGGTIVVDPDLTRFLSLLAWYWSIVLPVGALAVGVAWLVGRAITRRALDPLERVTSALRRIAGGDFQPEPLAGGAELGALTEAYNDVAYRLTAATAQHREDEARIRQFVADAGHELRTPLTVIMGYLDMLRHGSVREQDAVARVHETMHEESQRMRRVIEKLLLLARLERPAAQTPATVDVAAIVRRAAAEIAPLAADRIEVEAKTSATVEAEESDLYEAIKNVIDNAVRYAPESPVRVAVDSGPESVCITVTDRGPGIEAYDLPHVFERFYRAAGREAVEGTGLGLAIARKAVERAGGTIELESRSGEGTTVTIRLPRSA